MSLGEVDTLNLTFDKLQTLFDESQGYYESFLDANNLYKTGKLSDKEFFQKLGDYVVAYSALEFLSVKVIMEMKKTLDKIAAVNMLENVFLTISSCFHEICRAVLKTDAENHQSSGTRKPGRSSESLRPLRRAQSEHQAATLQ